METRSAFEKNFKAKANSIKPRTILVELSQLPDFGINLSALGNKANNPNGRPRAVPKPNIPNVNWVAPASEVIDPAKSDPKIGEWREELMQKYTVGFFELEPSSVGIYPALNRWLSKKYAQSVERPKSSARGRK